MITGSMIKAGIWEVGFEDVSGRLEIVLCTSLFPEKVSVLCAEVPGPSHHGRQRRQETTSED